MSIQLLSPRLHLQAGNNRIGIEQSQEALRFLHESEECKCKTVRFFI